VGEHLWVFNWGAFRKLGLSSWEFWGIQHGWGYRFFSIKIPKQVVERTFCGVVDEAMTLCKTKMAY
jgi:hypothetical protein